MAESLFVKIIDAHGLDLLTQIVKDLNIKGKLLLVADDRTYAAAGGRVAGILKAAGFSLTECILHRSESLVPDESALGELLVKVEQDTGLLVAVGSGSITDLTRYLSYKLQKPFMAVSTAPSMDGYASSVAPLTLRGFKQTFPAVAPVAIIGDTGILAKAPPEMIRAGFGDLLGKYTSLADWKLSSIITEEAFSGEIAALVRVTADRTAASLSGSVSDPALVANLTEALIASGEAMQRWGNSRPASGAEHHLAHFWEMQAALNGTKRHLHGTKVGVAVIIVAKIYQQLLALDRCQVAELIARRKPETEAEYALRVQKAYGPLAGDVLSDLKGLYLDPVTRAARQRRILSNWEPLRDWVRTNLPTPEKLREWLLQAGAAVTVGEIGVTEEMRQLSLQNAKEVRSRYTVFRLAEDIGWSTMLS
ncbi:MAG: sn-glycerol-1-phosphate dehydrogenase [Bacillota bacterium]|jgi:glycerol-1-phosphate dehydrogenase [NAD(P)+]